jgi:plastocyanin
MRLYETVIILLLLIPFCNAIPLLHVSPTSLNINIVKGYDRIYQLNIDTFNSTQTIYNITFLPVPNMIFGPIGNLTPNSSGLYQFHVYTNDIITSTYTSKISFNYLTQTTIQGTNHQIVIDNAGFHPSFLQLIRGDTITITNQENLNHSFTATDYSSDVPLIYNSNYTQTMNTVGDLHYFDRLTNYGLELNVLTNVQDSFTHSSDYDIPLTIYFNSNLQATQLSKQIFLTDYTINYNQTQQGAIMITNNGTEIAYGVSLDMQWATFSPNNFNLNPSESKVVAFSMTPILTSTDQSNRNYALNMTIKGTNTDPIYQVINVFVPLTSFLGGNGTCLDIAAVWAAKLAFCNSYPSSLECSVGPQIVYQNVTVYSDKPTNMTFTEDEVKTIKDNLKAGGDTFTREENMIKLFIKSQQDWMIYMENKSNATDFRTEVIYNLSTKNERRLNANETSSTITTVLIIAFIFFAVLGSGIYFILRQVNKQKNKRRSM